MAGGGETRLPSLPAVSWSSHMSPNKCAPFAGVELLPTPLSGPKGAVALERRREEGEGNILTTLALELRVGAVLVLLKLAHVIVVGCRGRCLQPPPPLPPLLSPSPGSLFSTNTLMVDLTLVCGVCGLRLPRDYDVETRWMMRFSFRHEESIKMSIVCFFLRFVAIFYVVQ